jgi:hypothetical protein
MLETILGNHGIRREAQENRRREPPASSVAHHNHMQENNHIARLHCCSQQKGRKQNAGCANRYLSERDIYPKQDREHRLGEFAKIAH